MVFRLAFLTSILLACTALAIPPSLLEARVAQRRVNRHSQPMNWLEAPAGFVSNEDYGPNWAGAVWGQGNGTFTTVTGTFTAPKPSGSSGAAAAAWVGIDGYTCQNALFQAGIEFSITDNGVSYQAWYEWFPDPPNYFSGFSVNAGDQIKATIIASSATSGTAVLENLTTGGTATAQGVTSTYALCGQSAEWIVEDFQEGNNLVSFANFGTVTFTGATASGPSGTTYTSSGANIVDIMQNGQVLTSSSTSGDTVTVKYV